MGKQRNRAQKGDHIFTCMEAALRNRCSEGVNLTRYFFFDQNVQFFKGFRTSTKLQGDIQLL